MREGKGGEEVIQKLSECGSQPNGFVWKKVQLVNCGEVVDESKKKNYIEFYTGHGCPYAQMTQIALNEKLKTMDPPIEVKIYEGLTVQEGEKYIVHPKLEALGQKGVPTLNHVLNGKNKILSGCNECINYIDETFGEKNILIPPTKGTMDRRQALLCERLVHERIVWGFYPMLLHRKKKWQ